VCTRQDASQTRSVSHPTNIATSLPPFIDIDLDLDPDIGIDIDIDRIRSLYRRSLKLALDWAVHRHIWRGQAVYIRSLFDANKDVRDPRQQKVLP
jgi:hypothetical protein